MNFIFKPESEIKLVEKTLKCYLTFCGDVYKEFYIKRGEYVNKRYDIISKYVSNELTKDEFISKMNILDEAHFYSDYYKNFASCVINNCYESCKKNLDNFILKIPDYKNKKSSKYTQYDFINIMKLYYYNNITLKIAKSKSLRNIIKMDKILYK
jgi:hypothetical protein